MSSLLFFDIDNTLWTGREQYVPDSTREAIAAARRRGHLCLINSGRSRSYLHEPLLYELGFDGIVSSCGMQIELTQLAGKVKPDWAEIAPDGSIRSLPTPEMKPVPGPVTEQGVDEAVIFYRRMGGDFTEEALALCAGCGCTPVLEGKEYSYIDRKAFLDVRYGNLLSSRMGSRLVEIEDHRGDIDITKLTICMPPGHEGVIREVFGDRFECMIHSRTVAELVPKGFDKGTGIREVCRLLGADIRDTVAFGDGANDIGMLDAAGCAVVMGDGAEGAKKHADLVTAPLLEDGIWKAMRRLELI